MICEKQEINIHTYIFFLTLSTYIYAMDYVISYTYMRYIVITQKPQLHNLAHIYTNLWNNMSILLIEAWYIYKWHHDSSNYISSGLWSCPKLDEVPTISPIKSCVCNGWDNIGILLSKGSSLITEFRNEENLSS